MRQLQAAPAWDRCSSSRDLTPGELEPGGCPPHARASLGQPQTSFGSGLAREKRAGASGRDVDAGDSKLDLASCAMPWMKDGPTATDPLTTYTTLVNYQQQPPADPFSAVVFDEIQR